MDSISAAQGSAEGQPRRAPFDIVELMARAYCGLAITATATITAVAGARPGRDHGHRLTTPVAMAGPFCLGPL